MPNEPSHKGGAMRRIGVKASVLLLLLVSGVLAGATAGRADETLSPLEIGAPPSCDS
jgi:hypothetical protein